jgi:hypothetical protein
MRRHSWAEKDPCAYASHRQILTSDLHVYILCSGRNRAANGGLKNKLFKILILNASNMCESLPDSISAAVFVIFLL